ncbi:unnamed protein product, partial [Prorocentrum cordatum]
AWWQCAADYPSINFEQVSHARFQFAKKTGKKVGASDVAGAQSIDARWKKLQKFLPKELK